MDGLLLIFLVAALVQLFYLLFFFRRLADYESKPVDEQNLPAVSVIICARNESDNLRKFLPRILDQNYPGYEVIVVNDNSEDDTEIFLTKLVSTYPRLVIRNLVQESQAMQGKKYPLTIGMRAAKNDFVLLTDADCIPVSSEWISCMSSRFTEGKDVVLGYAPFKRNKGLLNRFIRFETFMAAMQYLSFALARIPYMGVGRNIAYRKKLFFDHNIFPKYPSLLSGDDDLFVNASATRKNTVIELNKESFMISEPKKTWEEYWHQKSRHVSTGKFYKMKHQLLLGLFSFTHFFFYCMLLLALLYTNNQIEVLIIFSLRLTMQAIVFYNCMKRLGEEDLFTLFPLMDILFLIYYVKLIPELLQNKTSAWK